MIRKFFSLGILLLSFSCSSNSLITTTNDISYIKHQVKNINNSTKKITLSIYKKSFDTKQLSYSNAILPKKYIDIEYLKVFLIKESDYLNPFQSGANIFGDGVYKIFNKSLDFSNLIINNVPAGNTYKAVVAAFDINNLNITKENNDLASLDKRWFLSSNTVSVTETSITYSSGISLIVDLFLEDGEGAKVNSSVLIKSGDVDTEDIK
ncbi:MAG: hypothetical protein KatS3mg068_1245 [Candidatus Sericytochromatia bacterium]|nr:MAG: hypothetical protein KatS3mg068_1245 [Candidatus Sericytochromatia bacterium]